MSSEFDFVEEPKDRTKWIWLGIILIFGIMVAAMFTGGRPRPKQSAVDAKHILISLKDGGSDGRARARRTIDKLRERILAGESFAKLAREYSDDPQSAMRGGNLGLTNKGTFAENFEKFVWEDAQIGELSPVIETNFGFHLIVVTHRFVHATDKYEKDIYEKAIEEQRKGKQGTIEPAGEGNAEIKE